MRNCLYALVFAGALNTVLALFYYVKVLKVMVIEKPVEAVEGRSAPEVKVPALQTGYAVALAVLVVGLGIAWNALESVSRRGAEDLREPPARAAVAQGAPR